MNPLRWRPMTWLIFIFTGLMFAWIIGGANANSDNCAEYAVGSAGRSSCEAGTNIGTGIGVTIIFGLWFVGFIILSIIWFMTRPKRRMCPACGNEAKKNIAVCKKCVFNFAMGFNPQAGFQQGGPQFQGGSPMGQPYMPDQQPPSKRK